MKRNRSCGEAKGGRVNGEFVDPRNLPALPALVRVRDDEGSIFRWVIGYERSVTGTRKRVSRIVFLRDLPTTTEADLRDAEAWAEETARAFES